MRIWDIPASKLCRKHLLGEHRELHAIWSILTQDKKGYRHHPEVKRWEGRLCYLAIRHHEQVAEMTKRGWKHQSSLSKLGAVVMDSLLRPPELVNTIAEQYEILRNKGCDCLVAEVD
jgi:hypothetical protein